MPRFAKRDNTETRARNFQDERSFVALDGSLRLYGKDWEPMRDRVWNLHAGMCWNCDKPCTFSGGIHHLVPRGKGGSDDYSNLVWACTKCHRAAHEERNPKWTTKRT
jgi:5-methylcytosine-specific restriction endonuclease McrA